MICVTARTTSTFGGRIWAAKRPESGPEAAQIGKWTAGHPERARWSAALELAFEEDVAVPSGRPFDL